MTQRVWRSLLVHSLCGHTESICKGPGRFAQMVVCHRQSLPPQTFCGSGPRPPPGYTPRSSTSWTGLFGLNASFLKSENTAERVRQRLHLQTPGNRLISRCQPTLLSILPRPQRPRGLGPGTSGPTAAWAAGSPLQGRRRKELALSQQLGEGNLGIHPVSKDCFFKNLVYLFHTAHLIQG